MISCSGNLEVRKLAYNSMNQVLMVGFFQNPDNTIGSYDGFHVKIRGECPFFNEIKQILEKSYKEGIKVDIWHRGLNSRLKISSFNQLLDVVSVGYGDKQFQKI
eukprot:TRINITY_DN23617_c0_g1_i1.p4 TRINITY_DN23617_c0_g1~~TRINITY_DN23617_c0_g1_i1.p4  ORF type:complete len:104 (-),score=13.05 TRINITY_DN23617_c0_g1_i1:262-573(-)